MLRDQGRSLLHASRGASLVEYIVVLGVVALAVIAAFQKFGVSLYSKVRTEGDHVVTLTEMQGGSTYCFAAGTLVATPEGARAIESIRVGDNVLSRDDRTGETVSRPALQIFVTPDQALVEVRVHGDEAPILATPGHLFSTRGRGWIAAEKLLPGEPLSLADGDGVVDEVRPHAAHATVYNFEVEETHTYFVGARRALVHNPTATDCSGSPIASPPPSGSPSSCFVAGTKVGTPEGPRAIESLRAGDIVLSRDESTGATSPARITRTFVRHVTSLVDVRIADGSGAIDVVRATPEHPFWTIDRGWVGAGALVLDEPLLDARARPLFVVSVTAVSEDARVYNMEVEGAHTYFVGAHQAWVHNACDIFGQLFGDPPSPPIVSSQGIGNSIASGAIGPNGVGTYQITPSGAIQPAQPTNWWSFGNQPTQFQGQYIGLNGNQPAAGVPIDPNVNYVFTDNLSGCGVAVSTGSPPSMIHAPCANVSALSNPPATTDQQWNENMQQYLAANGYNPAGAIVVNNSLYGWNNASANSPDAPLPNSFFYGVQDGQPPVWKFKLVTTDPATGQLKIIPVGQANP